MFAPVFELEAFETLGVADRIACLGSMLEALCDIDRAYLRQFPSTPDFYASGVRYIAEPPGSPNRWSDIGRAMARGGTHCVGLSAWRVAELRERQREHARFRVAMYTDPTTRAITWHVYVIRGDGSEEDPSRKLGMKFPGE